MPRSVCGSRERWPASSAIVRSSKDMQQGKVSGLAAIKLRLFAAFGRVVQAHPAGQEVVSQNGHDLLRDRHDP